VFAGKKRRVVGKWTSEKNVATGKKEEKEIRLSQVK